MLLVFERIVEQGYVFRSRLHLNFGTPTSKMTSYNWSGNCLCSIKFIHQSISLINNSARSCHSRLSRLPEIAVNSRPHLWCRSPHLIRTVEKGRRWVRLRQSNRFGGDPWGLGREDPSCVWSDSKKRLRLIGPTPTGLTWLFFFFYSVLLPCFFPRSWSVFFQLSVRSRVAKMGKVFDAAEGRFCAMNLTLMRDCC